MSIQTKANEREGRNSLSTFKRKRAWKLSFKPQKEGVETLFLNITLFGAVAQWIEQGPSKPSVAGSSPVSPVWTFSSVA